MTSQDFSLRPFTPVRDFTLTGTVSREGTRLAITYRVAGPLRDLVIPPPDPQPARRWLLWEATCAEFFLAPPGEAGYWECNLSPAGHWNFFHLSGYRQGLAEEPAVPALAFTLTRGAETLTLALQVELGGIIAAHQALEMGLSCILEHQDGTWSYWALKHPPDGPDFHHRQGLIIKL